MIGALDVGRTPDGIPYLVMQHVDGVTLRSVLKSERISWERAADIIRQIGQALSAAHDRGVCHRDLKPENIMLQALPGGEDRVRLIDFEIATIRNPSDPGIGGETRVVGTLSYMAPEQLLGKPCAASDIYAIGVIAYEMLTKTRPFEARSAAEIYALQLRGRPALRKTFGELPDDAQKAILRALSFEPENRFSRPQEFGDCVAEALTSRQLSQQALQSNQKRMLDVAMAAKQIKARTRLF